MNNQPKLSLLDRLMLPTSPFFKPLAYVSAVLATLVTLLLVFQTNLEANGLSVPDWLITGSKYVGVISATVAALAQTTVDFDDDQVKKVIQINSVK